MEANQNLDTEKIIEELSTKLEDVIEDIISDHVESAVQDVLEESLHSSLSRFEFVLTEGTVVRPKTVAKVISPDKTKMLPCYGGLRVDGLSLIVQTSATCWERIAEYKSKEDAVNALKRMIDALRNIEETQSDKAPFIEL